MYRNAMNGKKSQLRDKKALTVYYEYKILDYFETLYKLRTTVDCPKSYGTFITSVINVVYSFCSINNDINEHTVHW